MDPFASLGERFHHHLIQRQLLRQPELIPQSEAGSRFVESMLTVVATLKQQNRNVLEYLTAAHEAALRGEPAPSLLPQADQESQAAA